MKKIEPFLNIIKNQKFVFALYTSLAIFIGVQVFFEGSYNNYVIFQHSVYHFFDHVNPYLEYKQEYFDLFLYNPSFLVFFIPFAYLPPYLGLVFWALTTVLFFYYSIKSLPIEHSHKLLIYYLIIPELVTSVDNMQTNLLIVSFTIFSMTLLEKNNHKKAAILPALNFFIKGYGGIAGIFFLLKNPKIKTFLMIAFWFFVIGLLPLVFYSVADFKILYNQWFTSLRQDYSVNTGISVMGVVKSVFYKDASVQGIQLIGVAIFFASFGLILIRKNYEELKLQFLANVLIWMIIFNHTSESPTYIIASTGAFIWYVGSKKTWLNIFLFVFFFVLTVMSPSDLFPRYVRITYVVPYSLKALPCILIWIKIQAKLFFPKTTETNITLWKRKLI